MGVQSPPGLEPDQIGLPRMNCLHPSFHRLVRIEMLFPLVYRRQNCYKKRSIKVRSLAIWLPVRDDDYPQSACWRGSLQTDYVWWGWRWATWLSSLFSQYIRRRGGPVYPDKTKVVDTRFDSSTKTSKFRSLLTACLRDSRYAKESRSHRWEKTPYPRHSSRRTDRKSVV